MRWYRSFDPSCGISLMNKSNVCYLRGVRRFPGPCEGFLSWYNAIAPAWVHRVISVGYSRYDPRNARLLSSSTPPSCGLDCPAWCLLHLTFISSNAGVRSKNRTGSTRWWDLTRSRRSTVYRRGIVLALFARPPPLRRVQFLSPIGPLSFPPPVEDVNPHPLILCG